MKIYPSESLILAPLSGYTDLPYRRSARRHGCLYAFTEMIDAGSLARGCKKTLRLLDRGADEKWLGTQIIGSDNAVLAKAAEVVNGYNFDVLDFNLGCPAKKVVRKGEGAALAKKTEDALRAIDAIIKTSKIPVSAKIRILNETDPESTLFLAEKLEDAGISALTVHGRIMSKGYSGNVCSEIIATVRSKLKIQVIANGGVVNYATFLSLREKTGCGLVMLARGAMGNPWLFREIMDAEKFIPPTPSELALEIRRHVCDMAEYYSETTGLRISRKTLLDYIRGRGYSGALKNTVAAIKTLKDLEVFLAEVEKGPSPRYRKWLEKNPSAPRRLK